jgi:hypothetical protein
MIFFFLIITLFAFTLEQRFPNCGPRTLKGPYVYHRGSANKNLKYSKYYYLLLFFNFICRYLFVLRGSRSFLLSLKGPAEKKVWETLP